MNGEYGRVHEKKKKKKGKITCASNRKKAKEINPRKLEMNTEARIKE